MAQTVPTPIVDKNGKQTTVHKKTDIASPSASRISAVPTAPKAKVNPEKIYDQLHEVQGVLADTTQRRFTRSEMTELALSVELAAPTKAIVVGAIDSAFNDAWDGAKLNTLGVFTQLQEAKLSLPLDQSHAAMVAKLVNHPRVSVNSLNQELETDSVPDTEDALTPTAPPVSNPLGFGNYVTDALDSYNRDSVGSVDALKSARDSLNNVIAIASRVEMNEAIHKIDNTVTEVEFELRPNKDSTGFHIDVDTFFRADGTHVPSMIDDHNYSDHFERLEIAFKKHAYDIIGNDGVSYSATGNFISFE